MALHEQSVGITDEWYTPKYIFDAMDCEFDTDVASPGKDVTPWIPAKRFICDGSLEKKWDGFVWMNPPFGKRNGLEPWLNKFILHWNGIALVPDRTSAPWWQYFAPQVDLVLFVKCKIKFINERGELGKSPAQGTCLCAVGERGKTALSNAARNNLGTMMRTQYD